MDIRYELEDEWHAEPQSEHATFADAIVELERRALISWDKAPNVAPCTSWRTCGRRYVINEYDASKEPWQLLRRLPVLEVDAKGVRWSADLPRRGSA